MLSRAVCFTAMTLAAGLQAQPGPPAMLARTMAEAQVFRDKALRTISRETLRQRSLRVPPHARFAIGEAAADPLTPRYLLHEVVSEYTVGALKGSAPPELVEFRELVLRDGLSVATPEKARRALLQDVQAGEERIRRRILEEFTNLGLLDVATDYGLMLLAFTREGMRDLEIAPGGAGFVGAEEACWFNWRQTSGGALEFRGRKVARRPLSGTLWVRKSDGLPLRISSWLEHPDGKHILRDEGIVDYVQSAFGMVAPATVVHRHEVDGEPLTENLYSYEPFRLFTTDTRIEYTGVPPASEKK